MASPSPFSLDDRDEAHSPQVPFPHLMPESPVLNARQPARFHPYPSPSTPSRSHLGDDKVVWRTWAELDSARMQSPDRSRTSSLRSTAPSLSIATPNSHHAPLGSSPSLSSKALPPISSWYPPDNNLQSSPMRRRNTDPFRLTSLSSRRSSTISLNLGQLDLSNEWSPVRTSRVSGRTRSPSPSPVRSPGSPRQAALLTRHRSATCLSGLGSGHHPSRSTLTSRALKGLSQPLSLTAMYETDPVDMRPPRVSSWGGDMTSSSFASKSAPAAATTPFCSASVGLSDVFTAGSDDVDADMTLASRRDSVPSASAQRAHSESTPASETFSAASSNGQHESRNESESDTEQCEMSNVQPVSHARHSSRSSISNTSIGAPEHAADDSPMDGVEMHNHENSSQTPLDYIFVSDVEQHAVICDKTQEELQCVMQGATHGCFVIVDGKWACYRRNYLKVDAVAQFVPKSGRSSTTPAAAAAPTSSSYYLQDRPNTPPRQISHFSLAISAHTSDRVGQLVPNAEDVPIIQFGPQRERGPREPVQRQKIEPGGTLAPSPLENELRRQTNQSVASFRRIQIRSATLNNGKTNRSASQQQYYVLRLTLFAHPKGPRGVARGVRVASYTSDPLTVRGRSKVHYAPTGPSPTPSGSASSVSIPSSGHRLRLQTHAHTGSTETKYNHSNSNTQQHAHRPSLSLPNLAGQRRSARLSIGPDRIDGKGGNGDDGDGDAGRDPDSGEPISPISPSTSTSNNLGSGVHRMHMRNRNRNCTRDDADQNPRQTHERKFSLSPSLGRGREREGDQAQAGAQSDDQEGENDEEGENENEKSNSGAENEAKNEGEGEEDEDWQFEPLLADSPILATFYPAGNTEKRPFRHYRVTGGAGAGGNESFANSVMDASAMGSNVNMSMSMPVQANMSRRGYRHEHAPNTSRSFGLGRGQEERVDIGRHKYDRERERELGCEQERERDLEQEHGRAYPTADGHGHVHAHLRYPTQMTYEGEDQQHADAGMDAEARLRREEGLSAEGGLGLYLP